MKASDVTPMTVIYQRQRSQYGLGERAVVLATGTWVHLYQGGRIQGGFSESPVTFMQTADKLSSRTSRGWLTLTQFAVPAGSTPVSDEDLLALAEQAMKAIADGGSPTNLPEGVRVGLNAAREIAQTWAEYEAEMERGRVARIAANERKDAQDIAEAGAKARITAVLGEEAVNALHCRFNFPRPWTIMEGVFNAYHEAKSAEVS